MADCVLVELEFFLNNLNRLLNSKNCLIGDKIIGPDDGNEIQSIYDELQLLRLVLRDSDETLFDNKEGKLLRWNMQKMIYEAEEHVDMFVMSLANDGEDMSEDTGFACPVFHDYKQEFRSIREDVLSMKVNRVGVRQLQRITPASSWAPGISATEADVIVGFEEDELYIINQLTGNQKHLDIISIVGMAGLGKTTLVKKIYNNPLILYNFPARAWITVSQVYQKENLLLSILNSLVPLEVPDKTLEINEQELRERLFRILKCYKYLIVIDDIWDANLLNDFRPLFPNEGNGSRVILTSRNKGVILVAFPYTEPYMMKFRTEQESWAVLKRKVFLEDVCPPVLVTIGKQIAKKCQGLPLIIVIIAGFLHKRDATMQEWKKVGESVSSLIVEDPKMVMNTVALSYTHLPRHLKPCFLYLAGFPEDYEIPVQKLIWLWLAEGFIRPKDGKSLEDTAIHFLSDLINRNLIIVSQRRYDGGIKTCCIHDLLREFCLTEAKRCKFLLQIYADEQEYPKNISRRIFIHFRFFENIFCNSSILHIRSCLFTSPCVNSTAHLENYSFVSPEFKLIRVLDLMAAKLYLFPREVSELLHLKYLAVWATVDSIPSSISNLRVLETFIYKGISTHVISLPYSLLKMTELRHVHIEDEAYIRDLSANKVTDTSYPGITTTTLPKEDLDPSLLRNMQSISTVHLSGSSDLLSCIPSVRKLGCVFSGSYGSVFPDLNNLVGLESLRLRINMEERSSSTVKFPLSYKFPLRLKKLSLSGCCLPWLEIPLLGKLPHLEVLKLLDNSFKGSQWDTSDGEFLQLRYLKFQGLDIQKWNAMSHHFPRLQHLQLLECPKLENIPYDFAGSCMLETIKLDHSSLSAIESAMAIKKEKMSVEDYSLKIYIRGGIKGKRRTKRI